MEGIVKEELMELKMEGLLEKIKVLEEIIILGVERELIGKYQEQIVVNMVKKEDLENEV